jgi:hypothetical protein
LGLFFHGKGIISSDIQQITLLLVSVSRKVEPVQPSGQSKEHATPYSVNALTILQFLRKEGQWKQKTRCDHAKEFNTPHFGIDTQQNLFDWRKEFFTVWVTTDSTTNEDLLY